MHFIFTFGVVVSEEREKTKEGQYICYIVCTLVLVPLGVVFLFTHNYLA